MDSRAEIVCCGIAECKSFNSVYPCRRSRAWAGDDLSTPIPALASAKARGTELGNPRSQESIERVRVAKGPVPVSLQLVEMVAQYRAAAIHCGTLRSGLIHSASGR